MKEHEREADLQYAATVVENETVDPNQRDRFGRDRFHRPFVGADARPSTIGTVGTGPPTGTHRRTGYETDPRLQAFIDNTRHLSKEQRRALFAAKVAHDEEEKRLAEQRRIYENHLAVLRREFETRCHVFGLDPRTTRAEDAPFGVDWNIGQWYSVTNQMIPTPPAYQNYVLPSYTTNPEDYELPEEIISKLPPNWKYAITPQGYIYYYHILHRIPQYEPPNEEQLDNNLYSSSSEESENTDSESEEDEFFLKMSPEELPAYLMRKALKRRNRRRKRLAEARPISPRREEDRIYNQTESRKYKENKEKLRRRKEELRRRRAASVSAATSIKTEKDKDAPENETTDTDFTPSMDTGAEPSAELSSLPIKSELDDEDDVPFGALPIQDYLLSSDEEEIRVECNNSPLIDKIVQGDKIVDELDALNNMRCLKRPPPPPLRVASELSEGDTCKQSTSKAASAKSIESASGEDQHKKRRQERRERAKKAKEASDSKQRKLKEKFRCEIAGIIVHHLKPYRKDSCLVGRIQSNEDFNHLARKLTQFVTLKEQKYCETVGTQTLVVTDSVKNKAREFIRKYMSKYGEIYVKPATDPEYKDIPHGL